MRYDRIIHTRYKGGTYCSIFFSSVCQNRKQIKVRQGQLEKGSSYLMKIDLKWYEIKLFSVRCLTRKSQSEEVKVRNELSDDTIVAIVTAINGQGGPGGVSIVRLSGDMALQIVTKLFNPGKLAKRKNRSWIPESHKVEYGWLFDPIAESEPIDEVRMDNLGLTCICQIL